MGVFCKVAFARWPTTRVPPWTTHLQRGQEGRTIRPFDLDATCILS